MRLFWKLFFMLMLALILTAVLSSWISRQWLMETHDIENRLTTLTSQAETATNLFEQEGPMAYRRWLVHTMRAHHFRGLLLNDQGKNVLETHVPEPLRPLARQVMNRQEMIRIVRPPNLAVAMPVSTGSSHFYWVAATRVPPETMRRSGEHMLVVRLLTSLLVILLISWLLTRLITRPVKSLQLTTEQIGKGHLDTKSPAALRSRKDELGDLARSIDTMTTQLGILVNSHKQLLRDVSHELRSPLARLQVALELARNKSEGAIEDELDRIGSEVNRLNTMIEEVLTLSRMEGGEQPNLLNNLRLDELISHVVEDARFEAEASDKEVSLTCDKKITVHGDPGLLRSALDNVIRNAIRHTSRGTAVDVSVSPGDNVVTITVRDRGPGVSEKNISRLFESFFRVSEAREHQGGGFGLGLAIAHRAVQLHGGNIRAKNHPDGGLVICLSIPATASI